MAPLSQNWLVRGAQSAIFYYVSCGPCLTAGNQRKRKRDAEESRRLNEKMLTQNPNAYTHPPAFGVNKYWQEEIDLGSKMPEVERNQLQVPQQMRYRRPDEEFLIVIEDDEDRESKLLNYGGLPEVNELHPPVTCFLPLREEEREWMKMAPPSTRYMEGKLGASIVKRAPSQREDHRGLSADEDSLVFIPPMSRDRYYHQSSDSDSDESGDADDESEGELPAKPRAVHRSVTLPYRRFGTVQRPGLPTVVSTNSVPRNKENASPHTSAHSHHSHNSHGSAISPMSSNESLPSPHLRPSYYHASKLSPISNSSQITSQLNISPRTMPSKPYVSRIDSQQDKIAEYTLDMERHDLHMDDHLAKEHMWLGARETPVVGSKRWSTEF